MTTTSGTKRFGEFRMSLSENRGLKIQIKAWNHSAEALKTVFRPLKARVGTFNTVYQGHFRPPYEIPAEMNIFTDLASK